jgi:hypothetical protein
MTPANEDRLAAFALQHPVFLLRFGDRLNINCSAGQETVLGQAKVLVCLIVEFLNGVPFFLSCAVRYTEVNGSQRCAKLLCQVGSLGRR